MMTINTPRRGMLLTALLALFAGGCDDLLGPGDDWWDDDRGDLRGNECRGTVGAATVDRVIVPAGATCYLEGTRVRGDVEVRRDAVLELDLDARIGGNLRGSGARTVLVLDTRVNGNIQMDNVFEVEIGGYTQVQGNVQLRSGRNVWVDDTAVDGDLQIDRSAGWVEASGNQVRGNFQLTRNTGGVSLRSNRVFQSLQCRDNRPAPTGSGNVAGRKEDQCSRL